MLNNFRNNNVILSSAIHMLIKFGDVKGAEHVFEMTKKNIVTYGAMMKSNLLYYILNFDKFILGYVENNMSENALDLFEKMPFNPNDVIYTIIFNACAQLADDYAMKIGKTLLDQMPDNFRNDTIILTSAIHMLMKFGDVTHAEHIFEMTKKDIVTYGAMMQGNLFIIIHVHF
jgi:hypothetical protein